MPNNTPSSGMIKFLTSDNKTVAFPRSLMHRSVALHYLFETLGISSEENTNPISIFLPSVSSRIFKMILAWCVHHHDDSFFSEEDLYDEKGIPKISKWDTEFLRVDKDTLYKLLMASSDLKLACLGNLIRKSMAKNLLGKSRIEIDYAIADFFGVRANVSYPGRW